MKIEKELIGLTIKESIELLNKRESFYQVYVCLMQHKTRDLKKLYKRVHIYNEKHERVYKIIDYDKIIFANSLELEQDNFVIDVMIEKSQHDNWSFSDYESTATHNAYYLIVGHLTKGNKGNAITINNKEQIITYKNGELTKRQRRITL